MSRGLYPQNVPLGEKARGWVEEELEALIRARINARNLGLKGEARDEFIRKALIDAAKAVAEACAGKAA
jgi:hypothetical protein